MRLRSNEFCPIHKSLSCCGRETLPKPRFVRLGVQRVEDPHHPRGYRELRLTCSPQKVCSISRGDLLQPIFVVQSAEHLLSSYPTIRR